MIPTESYIQLPCWDLELRRREIHLAFKDFIFYYEEREVGNIIKTCKKCKDKIYPQWYGNGKVKAPEQMQGMLFNILRSCKIWDMHQVMNYL